MDDRERDRLNLIEWMKEKNLDAKTVAEATGDTLSTIAMMINDDRRVNQAFKWRFRCAFGDEEASAVFGAAPIQAEPEPA